MIDCTNCELQKDCKAAGRQICPKEIMKKRGDAMSEIKDSGNRTEYPNGFIRDMHTGKGRMDLLPWNAIMELSRHCENGAAKYGEHNIDLGCPFHSLADSGARHLAKWIAGIQDEPHLLAACWNLMWLLEETVTKPELNDMFWNTSQKGSDDNS